MSIRGSDTARKTLQAATRIAHERLHTHAAFAALLRGELTRPRYRGLLACLLGLHEPIENGLGRLDAHPLLAWRGGMPVSRSALLRGDLAALGLDQSGIEAVPRARSMLPGLDDPASALGCAWVVEGSALGGRVMSGKVRALLEQEQGDAGGLFFASDPDQPLRWRGCCEAIEACGMQPDGLIAMTLAAVATFGAFETWLATIE